MVLNESGKHSEGFQNPNSPLYKEKDDVKTQLVNFNFYCNPVLCQFSLFSIYVSFSVEFSVSLL